MRVNVRKVFNAWLNHKPCNMKSISTDGHTIWSYSTAIVHRGDTGVAFNATKYSPTTSTQQGGLRFALAQAGIEYITLDDLNRGYTAFFALTHATERVKV